tara:strand:- start:552 stop:1145 length:594 start_codon:yes stop_codon:yes gene_type:complete
LQNIFDCLVNSFLEDGVGVVDNFLNDALAIRLRENLSELKEENRLSEAGIGNNAKLIADKSRRRDKIFWLDRKHNKPAENEFLDHIDEFVSYLNSTCYTGITGYEFHYALYEPGAFYKRHLDQFKDNRRRAFSMITYLNENWKEADGGKLCVYHEDREQLIEPISGKCVFFRSSQMEHEVLVSHQPRMSVTGWLKTN